MHVLWGGFNTDQNNVLTLGSAIFHIFSRECDNAGGSAGGGGQATGELYTFRLGVKHGVEQLVERSRRHAGNGFFLRDQTFLGHINGYAQGCCCGAFAGTGL